MGAVFVSYRRGDSEGQARALSIELARLVGKDSVFMDVDSIALGRDFRQVLQERLGSCDLMIALIGPNWLDAKDGAGNRRLESSTDFVRQEIAAALKRNIPVVPVLVQGAQVPPPERLPEELKDLSYRNGFELGHSTWESDIREMVKRLGLLAPTGENDARPTMTAPDRPAEAPAPSPPGASRRLPILALIALLAVSAGVFGYIHATRDTGSPLTQGAGGAENGLNRATAGGGTSPTAPAPTSTQTPLPSASTTAVEGGPAGSGVEFVWPGGDCWDIYRGEQYVTGQCGSGKQALGAGTYTIKGHYGAVFEPFDVTISAGTPTRVMKGGVFELQWPGGDCWDIYRGEHYVAGQCGSGKQALDAGTYTIKGHYGDVFSPFTVVVKNAFSTRVARGGVFEFKWPGGDCWDVYRGEQYVAGQCGSGKQALGAGTYAIKGHYGPVFEPFTITIRDGVTLTKP